MNNLQKRETNSFEALDRENITVTIPYKQAMDGGTNVFIFSSACRARTIYVHNEPRPEHLSDPALPIPSYPAGEALIDSHIHPYITPPKIQPSKKPTVRKGLSILSPHIHTHINHSPLSPRSCSSLQQVKICTNLHARRQCVVHHKMPKEDRRTKPR